MCVCVCVCLCVCMCVCVLSVVCVCTECVVCVLCVCVYMHIWGLYVRICRYVHVCLFSSHLISINLSVLYILILPMYIISVICNAFSFYTY